MPDIESLYSEKIEPNLAPVEEERKKLKSAIIFLILSFLFLIATIILIGITKDNLIIFPIVVAVAYIIYQSIKVYKYYNQYRSDFKKVVVAEIVKAVNPSWNYKPDSMISESIYSYSDIFRTRYDRYKGDDFVSGVIEKTDFECSELHTEYKEVTYDSKGNRHENWVTIFKGLFFHADFNKEFHGRTYVSPDVAERLFGKFGQSLQKITGPGELVKLENVDFEKEFVVHSTDQLEARYILTPAIMEAMLRIRSLNNQGVHFSFVGSRVFCALSVRKDLFEPKIFKTGVDIYEIANMYRLFEINQIIINELNLNTRIWSKN